MIELFIGLVQLVFILWFTFSVVAKLKRSECYLRELLHTAKPDHPYFLQSAEKPVEVLYGPAQVKQGQ
jgi:hypothetical protein